MNADLLLFVRESLARGIPRSTIADKLREAGWRQEEIDAALGAYAPVDFPVPVPQPRPYLSAREAFLYLVLFATLYATAFNVGAVLFRLIEAWMPDASQRWEDARSRAEGIRAATAALIIAFPIFLMVSRSISRAVARDPDKRASKIRKWLSYVTLFVAAMVIIGDLSFLVSRLLGGELPARVAAKVLVVFLIAGTVFSHYLSELRRDEKDVTSPNPTWRLPPRLVATSVLVVTLAGLLMAGSPGRARARQIDARRIEDLHGISEQVRVWTYEHRRLPETLAEVAATPNATGVRFRDPVSEDFYDYRTLDSLRYELCATFAAPDSLAPYAAQAQPSSFWRHEAGRTCFTFEVSARALTDPAPVTAMPRVP